MIIKVIVAVVAFCTALSGLILANMFIFMMIGEINRRRQDGDLVSYFGYTFPKMLRIFEEYRRVYPNGKLHIYFRLTFAVAMICLVIVAVCLGTIEVTT